jgi:hypothetical protein
MTIHLEDQNLQAEHRLGVTHILPAANSLAALRIPGVSPSKDRWKVVHHNREWVRQGFPEANIHPRRLGALSSQEEARQEMNSHPAGPPTCRLLVEWLVGHRILHQCWAGLHP